ncbi:hypothetical protein BDP81DRAFT_419445 [Colletotrichum phormii]|uniref:Uncharacterized protein n=1 Tax=Colletotrichum phormii TaxID=359342 RepID=A0AAI9ZYE8_9PEZI|nr:uncharacterized protein BDP81DRAFT_419445 [Colletotrichum phormii]KAK1640146.1 hypothetical protein BDP81DRAFT_419445 [Colletotrichum phormii]
MIGLISSQKFSIFANHDEVARPFPVQAHIVQIWPSAQQPMRHQKPAFSQPHLSSPRPLARTSTLQKAIYRLSLLDVYTLESSTTLSTSPQRCWIPFHFDGPTPFGSAAMRSSEGRRAIPRFRKRSTRQFSDGIATLPLRYAAPSGLMSLSKAEPGRDCRRLNLVLVLLAVLPPASSAAPIMAVP